MTRALLRVSMMCVQSCGLELRVETIIFVPVDCISRYTCCGRSNNAICYRVSVLVSMTEISRLCLGLPLVSVSEQDLGCKTWSLWL